MAIWSGNCGGAYHGLQGKYSHLMPLRDALVRSIRHDLNHPCSWDGITSLGVRTSKCARSTPL